jgi:hypothetical protein
MHTTPLTEGVLFIRIPFSASTPKSLGRRPVIYRSYGADNPFAA